MRSDGLYFGNCLTWIVVWYVRTFDGRIYIPIIDIFIYKKSLSLGRPPSIQLAHVDIKPPTCVGPGLYVPREEIVCKYLQRVSFSVVTTDSSF